MTENAERIVGTTLLFENETCRVWHLDLTAGQASNWHTHLCPYVFVVTRSGTVSTEYEDGSSEHQDDSRGTSKLHDSGRRHRLLNMSGGRYENIIVELKELSA